MSATEERPYGLGSVDDDALLIRYNEWSKNLLAIARKICTAKGSGYDDAGHSKWPCPLCVKAVQDLTMYWHQALLIKAKHVRALAVDKEMDPPLVDLSEAFFIASSVLDPATSVELEDWGVA